MNADRRPSACSPATPTTDRRPDELTISQQAETDLCGDGPYYVVSLTTWLTDRQAAFDLAKELSTELTKTGLIDEFGTAIGLEDDDVHGQERIYEYMDGISV
jgi:hypothetical protein